MGLPPLRLTRLYLKVYEPLPPETVALHENTSPT